MSDEIEIFVRDVSDVEGRVYARYVGPSDDEKVIVTGTLLGPFCKRARTLPAKILFRDLGPGEAGMAEAIVPDPCVWSAELPHLYQVDVEARQGKRLLAEYHGMIGLRPASESDSAT